MDTVSKPARTELVNALRQRYKGASEPREAKYPDRVRLSVNIPPEARNPIIEEEHERDPKAGCLPKRVYVGARAGNRR